MRISSEQQFQQGIDSILTQQAKLNITQEQVASGNRILTPSDDPAAATQVLKLSALIASNEQFERNVIFAQNQLELAEGRLGYAGNVIQRVRELVVQANNASQSNESRAAIGDEIQSRLDELVGVANSKDASGEYIFAGYNAKTIPFVKQGAGYVYQGDQGERLLQISEDLQIKVRNSGADIFQKVPEGDGRFVLTSPASNSGNLLVQTNTSSESVVDTYTLVFSQASATDPVSYQISGASSGIVASGTYQDGESVSFNGISLILQGRPEDSDNYTIVPAGKQDVFQALSDLAQQLKAPKTGGADLAKLGNDLGQSLNGLDQILGSLLSYRSSMGNRLQQLDVRITENADARLRYERSISELKDLDYASAIGRLNMQMTALQAAQQAYIKVQGLSLFNLLR
ncbi:MAG: flagellar hook-associated protein FlgL [Gammaproteobacteria bacterium]|jgi:flagellar hook-associated protein 3 FlgL|nr:flagellar hook-associated protein FlgL [Gammaproteobacteria bacterium]MBT5205224.1 flagellar hook-associated protein FlgL [Gammaproteobacteria bacterium]MBT5601447.1 flagellar hook-associated protein FlgL [Gammaproteobacteria bacterium]